MAIEAKLQGLTESNQFRNFLRCGREEIYRTCKSCGDVTTFRYACNRKWCPLCNYKIGQARAEIIREWAKRITQPKHLVLTMRNFPVLTRRKIREFQKSLLALRRRQVFSTVRGGCLSMEITNEGNGWHLHAHCLLDVDWLAMDKLAIEWGNLLGQEFGIVKIKDVRNTEYVQEVAKYVAKGSELAGWQPEQLLEFIQAIRGVRFFAAFGDLRKQSREIKQQLLSQRPPPPVCTCGCTEYGYEDEQQALIHQLRREAKRR